MFGEWIQDLESLEAISQDKEARQIFSRMAALSQQGRLGTSLLELAGTSDLDDLTKGTLTEIARDEPATEASFRRMTKRVNRTVLATVEIDTELVIWPRWREGNGEPSAHLALLPHGRLIGKR